MRRLTVEHRTVYRYAEPVAFGQHRLMLRPRDSHGLRLHDARLSLSPGGEVRYIYDIFGNSIAIVDFRGTASELRIESVLELDSYASAQIDGLLDPAAAVYPFINSSSDRFDSATLVARGYPDDGAVRAWVETFIPRGASMDTLAMLKKINNAVKADFTYNARYEEGTQSPERTLALGSGTCRDFALLFIEAVRELGIPARFVTGYLYTPHLDLNLASAQEFQGAGATHAWAEVYLPGAGWIDFDPTNALVGTDHLVRVAVVRDPRQASPIVGSFVGSSNAFIAMDVEVFVSSRCPPPAYWDEDAAPPVAPDAVTAEEVVAPVTGHEGAAAATPAPATAGLSDSEDVPGSGEAPEAAPVADAAPAVVPRPDQAAPSAPEERVEAPMAG